MQTTTTDQDKTIAIISYITIIGWVIAYVMNQKERSVLGAYHIRQSLGLMILYLALWVFFMILNYIIYIPLLSTIIYLGVFVLWILGLISAIQGEMKPIPVFGVQFQQWFKNIG